MKKIIFSLFIFTFTALFALADEKQDALNFFNNYTNIELNNKLIIADVYDLGEENLKYGMYLFTDIFWDKIKENREEKKAIYLDEIWRLIRSYF